MTLFQQTNSPKVEPITSKFAATAATVTTPEKQLQEMVAAQFISYSATREAIKGVVGTYRR